MEKINKYFWAVFIVFIITSAYLASGLVAQIIGEKTMPTSDSKAKEVKKIARHDMRPSINYYSVILDRNIFNSAHNPLEGEEGVEVAVASSNFKLWGTIAWTPERSVAIIEDSSTKKVDVYKVGDKIGGYEVKKIERARVYLVSGGREEVIELPNITKASSFTPPSGGSGQLAALSTEGIKQQGNKFEVPSEFVDKVMGDMSQLMRGAKFIPHFKDGKVEGFKVFGIRKGSLYEQIGLKNGDIVQRVNGVELTGPEQALQVFEMLRNESQITVDIIRGGNNQTLTYTIR